MAHSPKNRSPEVTRLKPGSGMLGLVALGVGVVALVASAVIGRVSEGGGKRFFFAYLFAYSYFLAIAAAGVLWVLIQHLVRAGWSTNVRRILETFAANVWVMGVLALPILFTVATNGNYVKIYSWAPADTTVPDHHGGGHEAGGHGAADHGEAGHGPATGESHSPTTDVVSHVVAVKGSGDQASVSGDAGSDAAAHATGTAAHGDVPHMAVDEPGESAASEHTARNSAEYEEQKKEQLSPGSLRPYDAVMAKKSAWLNPFFFVTRIITYFSILGLVGFMYHRASTRQDTSFDIESSVRMGKASAPMLMLCGVALSFLAFDLFMSLDPHWFSTMFSVYYFAGGTQAMWALTIIMMMALQKSGYLRQSVTTEHYQDMGKWLFAFTFFWGYVTFSQYMLQWYANLPEETFWFQKRGAGAGPEDAANPFHNWMVALVLIRFLLPFPFLMSKHIKRRRATLLTATLIIMAAHLIDSYIIVMPENDGQAYFGAVELLAWLGIGGVFLGCVIRSLAQHELRPVGDPRTTESLAFQNI